MESLKMMELLLVFVVLAIFFNKVYMYNSKAFKYIKPIGKFSLLNIYCLFIRLCIIILNISLLCIYVNMIK